MSYLHDHKECASCRAADKEIESLTTEVGRQLKEITEPLRAELAEAKAAKELAEAQRDELMDASGTLINKWIQTGEGMQTHPCQIFLPAVDEWWRHVCRVVYPKPTGGTNG